MLLLSISSVPYPETVTFNGTKVPRCVPQHTTHLLLSPYAVLLSPGHRHWDRDPTTYGYCGSWSRSHGHGVRSSATGAERLEAGPPRSRIPDLDIWIQIPHVFPVACRQWRGGKAARPGPGSQVPGLKMGGDTLSAAHVLAALSASSKLKKEDYQNARKATPANNPVN